MSSHHDPQHYHIDPPRQPYPPQQPIQPYVEPGALPATGGQPPYQPPGGYAPTPTPPPSPRGRATVLIASILSVALLAAAGAFVLLKFVWTSGPDPAERFPATASMYVELNLDPSFDQTPKLLEHLSKFEGIDYDSTDDLWAALLDETNLEGVEADRDLTSWLGRRHGLAMWEHDGRPYGVVNLASTDAGAAEAGLERIREASGDNEDEWAYSVGEDSVLMVFGDGDARSALDAARSEAENSPLSSAEDYERARTWLGGDQLLITWVDIDALAETGEALDEDDFAIVAETFSGHAIGGISAFDEGFEFTYRVFGAEAAAWAGSEDLLETMGDEAAADLVVRAEIPGDLTETAQEWIDRLEAESGSDAGASDAPAGGPLTDQEYAEYLELDERWWGDDLTEEEASRHESLEERYWHYGTEDEPWGYDHEDGSDVGDVIGSGEALLDLLSGAVVTAGADFDAEAGIDPESLFVSAVLDGADADELASILEDATGDLSGVETDGSTLSYRGSRVADGILAEDPRFGGFADAAPENTALAVWIDLSEIHTFEDDLDEAEPLSAFTWAHGTVEGDGTGLARLYLK